MPKMGYFVVDNNLQQIHGFSRYDSLHAACEDAVEYLQLTRHYPEKFPERIIVCGMESYSYATDVPQHILLILVPGADLAGWREGS